MGRSQKKTILVIEDARGITLGYKTILESNYDVTVSFSGEETQVLIDKNTNFDLAIVDIMLPVEDKKYTLAECQDTGLRLIKQMIEKALCYRFYVISVRSDVESQIKEICAQSAVMRYDHKSEYTPEDLQDNVAKLLETPIPN